MSLLPRKIPWTARPPGGVGMDWASPITRDLVAYFPLTYLTERDITGKSRTATLTKGGSPTPDREQGFPSTYFNRASNEKILIDKTALFDTAGLNTWAIEIWALFDGSSSTTYDLVGQWNSASLNKHVIITGPHNNNKAFLEVKNDAEASVVVSNQGPTLYPTDGLWHQILATFEANTAAHLYVDGALIGSDTSSVGIMDTDSSENWVVGGQQDFNNNLYYGWLRDLRFWRRVLTPEEVRSLYWDHWQVFEPQMQFLPVAAGAPPVGGRIMSSLAYHGGLAGQGGIAGAGGGLAG